MAETRRVIAWLHARGLARFDCLVAPVGGAAIDDQGTPITSATMDHAREADAVLLGAVGGPKWDAVAFDRRPEAGLMRLRTELGVFANLRPATCYDALVDASPLARAAARGLDILIVRELTGGVYFGEPKEQVTLEDGTRRAVDTQWYHESEIERIVRVAFALARKRSNQVTSVEKRNVMKTGVLWNRVARECHDVHGTGVSLDHMLADTCAMQLVLHPKQFDVIVTDNLFGDLLSDLAAALTGSLGLLPSASLAAFTDDATSPSTAHGVYEPVHGSAPDIAGQGKANPLAMLKSFAMACTYSLELPQIARGLDQAIEAALNAQLRTPDIAAGKPAVGTAAMTDGVLTHLEAYFTRVG